MPYNTLHAFPTAMPSLPSKSSVLHWYLENSDHSTVSMALPLPECLVVGLTLHVAFSDWLVSIRNMHLTCMNTGTQLNEPPRGPQNRHIYKADWWVPIDWEGGRIEGWVFTGFSFFLE